jgi:hypothetical protein
MEVSQKRLIRSEERTLLRVTADARARSSADQLRPCLPLATRRDLADRLGDVRHEPLASFAAFRFDDGEKGKVCCYS